MKIIDEDEWKYSLTSPNKEIIASFSATGGSMDGNSAYGNFELRNKMGAPLVSFSGCARATFSDDSKYFIYQKIYGRRSINIALNTVIDAVSGNEIWFRSYANGIYSEEKKAVFNLVVNGKTVTTLESDQTIFDISQCNFQRLAEKRDFGR